MGNVKMKKIIFQEWQPVSKFNSVLAEEEIAKADSNAISPVANTCNIRNSVHLLSLRVRQNLLHSRLKKKLTVTELAHRIGVTAADIIELESGNRFPGPEDLFKLEEALQVSITPHV